MLSKGYGVSPSLEFSIGGVPVRYESITSLVVILEENKHDLVELVIAGFPPGELHTYWNKPVRLSIDLGASLYYEFVGYIDNVRASSDSSKGLVNRSPIQAASVVCLGASYAMRGSNTRVWSNHRFEDILATFARTYGFRSDCIRRGNIYDALAQTGESDWQFLVRAATIQGLSVNCHGTHIHAYDPYQAFSRRVSFHVLSTLITSGGDPTPLPGQILSLKGVFKQQLLNRTSVMMPNGATLDINGDGTTGSSLATKTPTFSTSVEQGMAAVAASRKEAYDQSIEVSVVGLPGCLPGGIVKIDGYSLEMDDYWYVKSVKHRISDNYFVSDMSLTRNIDNELTNTNTPAFRLQNDTYFDGNRWVARKRAFNVYS